MKRIICAICVLVALSAKAEVKLPSFFCDNMVLQQQTECNLWGTADANKTVSIITSWDGKTYKVKAGANGKVEAKVRTPKAGGPYDITLNDGKKLVLRNILIGEVWICAGQSNMDMQLKGYKGQPLDGTTEELLNCKDDNLRLLFVKRTAQLEPQYDIKGGTWSAAGLICTAYGGSACEAWMKADWLRAFPKVQQTITEADVKARLQRCPTAVYNGQLYPLIGYSMRGAIWYQGEDNVPRYDYYADLLKAMVEGWRSEWKQGDFPFYYCQIAPYDYSRIG